MEIINGCRLAILNMIGQKLNGFFPQQQFIILQGFVKMAIENFLCNSVHGQTDRVEDITQYLLGRDKTENVKKIHLFHNPFLTLGQLTVECLNVCFV